MYGQHEHLCERLDAEVFSGELLVTGLQEFKKYVERWQQAIAEHEAMPPLPPDSEE